MKKSPYLHVLKTYLQELEKLGDKLPGLRGRVNYRGIAVESGIPKCKFKPGSDLRLLVEAAIARLGLRDGGIYEQPRRALSTERSTSAATYSDLVASGDLWLRKQGYAEASVRSYKSRLNAFKRHFGRTDMSSTAEDFGSNFEGRLATYLKARIKTKRLPRYCAYGQGSITKCTRARPCR